MHGRIGRLFGKYTEEMFFEGDQSAWNPMRYIPTPFHTKFAQERTALSQYIQQEAIGTRMRRWERPIHDFLAPYLRGAIARVTGEDVIPQEVQHRRDLDTLADMLEFLRAEAQAGRDTDMETYIHTYSTRSLPRAAQHIPARAGGPRNPAPGAVPSEAGHSVPVRVSSRQHSVASSFTTYSMFSTIFDDG